MSSIRTHPQGPQPRLALVGRRRVRWPRPLRAADRCHLAVHEAAQLGVHVGQPPQVLRGQVAVSRSGWGRARVCACVRACARCRT